MTADGNPSQALSHVFTPLRLRHRTLTSRITFGAHTANMAEGGRPGDRHLAYYRERALGGAAMIVVEPVPTHVTGILTRGNFLVDDDSLVPDFRRLTDACHEVADVTMVQQLYHVGQHGDADNSFAPSWSPSGLPSYHDADGSHAMSAAEIGELLDGFVRAAARAQRAGFDGVELFAAYHAVIDQFWTPWSNRRGDAWGGSLEGRLRFSSTLLRRIREACGDDFIVGLAVSMDPGSPASLRIEELQEIVAWHDERALMDYVTCGTGSYFDFTAIIPPSLFPARLGEPFAAALKEVTSHAVVQAESHIRTPQAAEEVLAAAHADLVSIVRGQIADPHLVTKAREGRAAEVRPCISCNQLCWGRRSRDYWISCLINPSAGLEHEWGGDRFAPAATPRSVLVVGAGPGGLEAARVAAERGHAVTVLEARERLGGQWVLAGRQPTRGQVLDHLAWYERELDRLGVTVRLDTAATVNDVLAAGAEAVVVATGARPADTGFQRALPLVERLPGIDDATAVSIHAVLDGAVVPTGRVLVLDDLGDWRGIGTAMHLQEAGCQVTLLTAAPAAAAGLFHSAADGPARRRFARGGGEVLAQHVVCSWAPGAALVRSTLTDVEQTLAADWLVVAETPVPRTELLAALDAAGVAHHDVGDCVAARRASLAIYEGRRLALTL